MPHYHSQGKVPKKRHTAFRQPNGNLYHEELFSTEGFSNLYSLIYHINPPTAILQVGEPYSVAPKVAFDKHLMPRSFKGFEVAPKDDYLESRTAVLVNSDLQISLAAPKKSMTDYFYKNADADELIFIHEGSGVLKTGYGHIEFEYGDYLNIPRGTIYQMTFFSEKNRHYIVESFSPVVYPKRYRNELGQLLEHSPYCERDIKQPLEMVTHDEEGEFKLLIKKEGMMYPYVYQFHPFDFVGWDGFHYPYALSIHDFEPITGRIHQPPPVHQTFSAHNFVVCSFCPRLYDYHPDSVPAPYAHSNIDSDEVMYYVAGQFMSKGHVDVGQMSLHPGGIPHGPTPGAAEKSIGKTGTEELAVMVDTFKPLKITEAALGIEYKDYYLSWLEKKETT